MPWPSAYFSFLTSLIEEDKKSKIVEKRKIGNRGKMKRLELLATAVFVPPAPISLIKFFNCDMILTLIKLKR